MEGLISLYDHRDEIVTCNVPDFRVIVIREIPTA